MSKKKRPATSFAKRSCVIATEIALAVIASQLAYAQQAQKIEKIEVTGSSIKRVESEGALPVLTLTREDIAKTGVTSVTDLIQMLPSMQGFVPVGNSVNGTGAGGTTAALHALPSKYTLVLLDGQRLAPQLLGGGYIGGGFGVNLESIPLDAVERVEILTDGASALYGSDAIAGVVNFILRKNRTDGTISITDNYTQHPGAGSWNLALSKGWGDLEKDRYNVLLSYSHDSQEKLDATQRSFSALGAYFPFSANGTNYIFNQRTSNTEPANLTFRARPTGGGATAAYTINPYYRLNGNCGSGFAGVITDFAALQAIGESCRFNYAATVEDIPQSQRDSGLLKGTFKLNDNTTLWGTFAVSTFDLTSRYAPPAQPLPVNATTRLPTLYNAYILPYLTANGLTYVSSGQLGYRAVQNGGRTDNYVTNANHLSIGVDGSAMGWDYKASVTRSHSVFSDTLVGGYSSFDRLSALVSSGAYDPVLRIGSSAPAIVHEKFQENTSDLNTLHFGAQHDLFQMAGGPSVIALGADYTTFHFKENFSDLGLSQSGFTTQPVSTDFVVGGGGGNVPFDASRNNWGVYAEWLLPVTRRLDVTLSGRYDSYDKTHSKAVFGLTPDPNTGLIPQVGDADLGNTFTKATGKVNLRFTPVDTVLLRASYGTGFKAPNISDIAGALIFGGSTAGSYACPFPGSAGCLPGSAQYDLVAGPNGLSGSAGLKPEKSTQWTAGFRFEPTRSVSLGLDWWQVKIKDQVLSSGIAEQVGFGNPQQYANLFINPYLGDPSGITTIAFEQVPFNGGEARYQGIDWDMSYRANLSSWGKLALVSTGTYMLKQEYNFGPGLPFNTDLGVFGPDNQVVFRTIMNFAASLQTGPFANTLIAHYKSGYKDQGYPASTSIFLANADGSQGGTTAFCCLRVASYATWDWQTRYAFTKSLIGTFGVRNLFDRKPPLTLQNAGPGNQLGYDSRYADATLRTYYVTAQFRF